VGVRRDVEKGAHLPGVQGAALLPPCATPLSNFEVNEGYKDVAGPSITVTFPIAGDERTKLLVWTTTPWTLPSNVVCAVGPDITYVKIRDGENIFILAQDRLAAYYRDAGGYEVLAAMKQGT